MSEEISIQELGKALTDKQRLFAEYYLTECKFNGVESARKAGYKGSYSTLGVTAHDNLKNPKIRAYLDARLSELTMSANEVLARLAEHARGSLMDVLDDNGDFDLSSVRQRGKDGLLKKMKISSTYNPATKETTHNYEYEIHDKLSALEKIGKYHKLFTEKTEITGKDGSPIETTSTIIIQGVEGKPQPDDANSEHN